MYIIGICGGTGSGKSLTARKIQQKLPPNSSLIISQDRFYVNAVSDNFDVPEAIDFKLMVSIIQSINEQDQKSIELPLYDFKTHQRLTETESITIKPSLTILILEGILLFHIPQIRQLCDLKIFVDADNDIRYARRIARDLKERGRTIDSIMKQWEATVKPAHDSLVEPSKKYADLIIPNTRKNKFTGIDFVCTSILNIIS
jgi:uridine kinase